MKKKVIRSTITLVGDVFDDSGNNVLTVEGLRTSAVIQFGGGAVMPSAEVIIYGLSMQVMRRMMRIRWQDLNSMMNRIRIEVGEQGEPLVQVFQGNITFAYIDTSNAPEIGLRLTCMAGVVEAYRPATPVSYPGAKSVVAAIEEITLGMGYRFENSGVPGSLMMEDVTLVETDLNKIRKLCAAYQIDLYIDNALIAICPQGAPRKMRIPVLSPSTGLIGYPVPTTQGVDVRCFFNPMVKFGGIIRIRDSLMETANGDWRAFGVSLNLESETPGGNWFMDIKASHREANSAAISR